ncbi:zf-UBP-domain-containing protein [Hesseltinella vesiculosa]|uniref:Zf-UBP-domain-containing protein n=1 Tax=Hesseltinella vesiculosa TaxID=101127 RepID=A0A1X2GY06_9FUNG|nr:zf-UBP-domain-containing protein [Hesseltinella vesiculosa]
MYYFHLAIVFYGDDLPCLPQSIFSELPISTQDPIPELYRLSLTSAEPAIDPRIGPLQIVSMQTNQHAEMQMECGIVHLYRDNQPAPDHLLPETMAAASLLDSYDVEHQDLGLIVASLAIPTSFSIDDFMNFVHPFHDTICHYRFLRDAAPNRYLALMKFDSVLSAYQFHVKFNGRQFHGLKPEVCHTVFLASVTWQTQPAALPLLTLGTTEPQTPPSNTLELPTCPICLERLDESITEMKGFTCQHSFDCGCLTKWGHGSCRVCQWSEKPVLDDPSSAVHRRNADGWLLARYEQPLSCFVCHATERLWICLICGHVGCGRYQDAHAFVHYRETNHRFALERDTQEVWDYIGDGYVHRWIQNTVDGKLVEFPTLTSSRPPLPLSPSSSSSQPAGYHHPPDPPGKATSTTAELIPSTASASSAAHQQATPATSSKTPIPSTYPRSAAKPPAASYDDTNHSKLEAMSVEYTTLLTSQIDSQRIFYEDQLDALAQQLSQLTARQAQLQRQLDHLASQPPPQPSAETLSSQLSQLQQRHFDLDTDQTHWKFSHDAMKAKWEKEKAHTTELSNTSEELKSTLASKKTQLTDLTEEIRDMEFFIQARSTIQDTDMAGGTVETATPKRTKKTRKPGRRKP